MTVTAITESLNPVFEQYGGKVVFAYMFRSVAKGEVAPEGRLSDVSRLWNGDASGISRHRTFAGRAVLVYAGKDKAGSVLWLGRICNVRYK